MASSQTDRIGTAAPVRVFATPGTVCVLTAADAGGWVEIAVAGQAVTCTLPSNGGPYTIVDGSNDAASYPITVMDSSGNTVGTIAINGGYASFSWNGTAMVAAALPNAISAFSYTPSGTGAVKRTAASKMGEWLSAADFGCVGDGTTSDTTAFAAAVAAATLANVPLLVTGLSGDTLRLSASASVACSLNFLAGGVLSIDSGQTITISGHIEAPRSKIFTGSGAVTLSGPSTAVVHWWGASSNYAAPFNDTAFTAAAAASTSVYVPAGTFAKNTSVSTPQFWGPGVLAVGSATQHLSPTPVLPPPPVNLAPNSQAEVISSLGDGPKFYINGTGAMPNMTVTGYTTGSNSCVLSISGSTYDTKIDDLINITGAGADAVLKAVPMRVTAIVANSSITIALPLGLKPSASGACTASNVTPGAAGSTGNGDGPDGWRKSTTLWLWREDNAVNRMPDALYSFGVQKHSSAAEYLNIGWPVSHAVPGAPIPIPLGKTITFGANVYQKVKGGSGTWNAYISTNGTGGGFFNGVSGTSTSGFQWSEVTATIPLDATIITVGIAFAGASGDTYYMCNPVLTEGSFIGPNNYQKPRNEIVSPIAGISLITWRNATVTFPAVADPQTTYSFTLDPYAETGGALAPSIRAMDVQLEGLNSQAVVTGTTVARLIAFRTNAAAPTIYSPVMRQTVANVAMEASGTLVLDGTGRAVCYSGVASDPWFGVSMDTWGYLLS